MPKNARQLDRSNPSKPHPEGEDNVSREDALRLLGVKKATLYTYVSRGWIQSFPLDEGRSHVFSRADVERLRARGQARAGTGAVAQAAMHYGEPIITSRITEITPEGPRYRGRLAVDLAQQNAAFETVALWLWTGVWLDDQVRWNDVPDFKPAGLAKACEATDTDDFTKSMASVVLALGMRTTESEQSSLAETLAAARRIIQVLSGMLGRLSPRRGYTPVLAGERLSGATLRILGGRAQPENIAALNAMMVLCADYELTPASFAARVVASAGADLYASVSAGLCAHSGLLTGQICDKLTVLLSGGSGGPKLEQRLEEVRKFGATMYGFNHALATRGDPRAYWMIERAKALALKTPSPVTGRIVRFLEHIREDFGLYPGLPAGLVTLTAALGLPSRSAAAVWGIARTAGQIAHVIEQRNAGFVLRPRAMFVSA